MRYRNKKTGYVISVNAILGGDWEIFPSPPVPCEPAEEKPKEKPKRTRRKKEEK